MVVLTLRRCVLCTLLYTESQAARSRKVRQTQVVRDATAGAEQEGNLENLIKMI